MKRVGQLLLFLCLTTSPAELLHAQDSQWWPELDTFWNVNQKTRLSFFVKRSTDGNTYDSVEYGPNFDFSLKALRKGPRTNDATKFKYLSFRIGYRYFSNTDGPNENRVILQLTPRFPLPWSLLLSDRNRSDLRWISGKFNWRYRNRLALERSFRIGSASVTPFVRDEIYYESRFDGWVQNDYAIGVSVPLGRRLEAEPYYKRQNHSRSTPRHVNAIGLKFSLYF